MSDADATANEVRMKLEAWSQHYRSRIQEQETMSATSSGSQPSLAINAGTGLRAGAAGAKDENVGSSSSASTAGGGSILTSAQAFKQFMLQQHELQTKSREQEERKRQEEAAVASFAANSPIHRFPAAFCNARAAGRALQAREPAELMSGRPMTEFAKMVCAQSEHEMASSRKVAAAKNETRLMEGLHRSARSGSSEAIDHAVAETSRMEELHRQALMGSRQDARVEAQGTQGGDDTAQMQKLLIEQMQMQSQMPEMQQMMQQMAAMQRQSPPPPPPAAVQPELQLALPASADGGAGPSEAAPSDQDAAVFDAVFAAQQAQYMRQLEFMNSMRAQSVSNNLIGHPTGPLYECRFADDFRPLQYCKKFYSSEGCYRGNQCTYAHCFEELHPNVQELHNSGQGGDAFGAEQDMDEASKAVPDMKMKRKKEICKKWKRDGECLVGKHCPFAHGEHEIGTVELVVMEQVKIKICKFWESDKCIYGKRCINAHGKEELGMKKPAFRMPMQSNKKRKEGESIETWRQSIFKQDFPGQRP